VSFRDAELHLLHLAGWEPAPRLPALHSELARCLQSWQRVAFARLAQRMVSRGKRKEQGRKMGGPDHYGSADGSHDPTAETN